MSAKSTPRSKTAVKAPGFRIEIDGVDLEGEAFSAQSIGVDLVLKGRGMFTTKLVGNGVSGAEASWMDGPLLGIGKQVRISVIEAQAPITMMNGGISSIRANFPSNGAPTLEISGEGIGSAGPTKIGSRKPIGLRWGTELLTFEPEIGLIAVPGIRYATKPFKSKRAGPSPSTTTGIGECVGSPEIMPGNIVTLEGLGTAFSGNYKVLRTVHTVNGTDGYRTMFVVEKQ